MERVGGATSYNVYRSTASTGRTSGRAEERDNYFTDAGLVDGRRSIMSSAAVNQAGVCEVVGHALRRDHCVRPVDAVDR